jgi:hypothetical protein
LKLGVKDSGRVHALDDHRDAAALQGDSGGTASGLAVPADDALHGFFLSA